MARRTWYIYGCGGLGLETLDVLFDSIEFNSAEKWDVQFLIDSKSNERKVAGIDVITPSEVRENSIFTVAVGEPIDRKRMFENGVRFGLCPSSITSKRAFISPTASIGPGCVIAPFTSIQSNVVIGANVSVNTQAIVGHHSKLLSGVVLSSQVNVGGNSTIGAHSYIGMGSNIKEGTEIGAWSIVGMGSVVYKDVRDNAIAIGNPARVVKNNDRKRVFS